MARSGTGAYLLAWLALQGLLAINVAGTLLAPGLFGPWLNLAIAAAQALCLVTVFMYAGSGAGLIRVVAVSGFFWLWLFLALSLGDYQTRVEDIAIGRIIPLHPHAYDQENAAPLPE
jgi:caa(3)-type oxidase subunit IV